MSRIPPLRTGANGAGNPTNGFYYNNGPRSYDRSNEDVSSSRGISAERPGRSRRAAGYGGLESPDVDTSASQRSAPVGRPASLERSGAERRSGEERWQMAQIPSSSPSRSRASAGRQSVGTRLMEDVLKYIQQDFGFMTDEKCIPVQIALKLLDSSSLGLASRQREFDSTHEQLQTALKTIVNEHHQGFNSSIGTFHMIQASLQSSTQRVRTLRDSLLMAKNNLSATKPELKGLASASQNYDDMLQVLGVIEQLQLIPEKLEARISEKRFLTAVEILQDALRMIRRSEMEKIGALSDLRVYLSNQEHSLTDILIEELHSHLYLKSPYCEDRWKIYAQNQSRMNAGDGSQVPMEIRGRVLYAFLDKMDTSVAMADDASRNPEADTFGYIQLIIEALNKMSRLEVAIDTIEQRLPVELFKVVEKSNNEVAQRHPSSLRAFANKGKRKTDMTFDNDSARSALLSDLLWTLYARFEAIAEGHRVVHDVITGIAKREGLRDTTALTRGFKELWKLYQSEIRSVLHDYLATDGDMSYRPNDGKTASRNVFRANRDKNKRMFKLSDMDGKSSELAAEKEDLEVILKATVPGLVSDSKRPDGITTSHSQNMHDGSATGHKLLVEPSVFNMGILLPPSLDFLNRLKEIVPPASDIVMSTLTSFLDDFLVNVFQPQLDETLVDLCAQSFIEIDAFQPDAQWSEQAKRPIFKGSTRFFALVLAFCKMLDNLPHDQAFSQLIITQMKTYYDKCSGWYKALVSRAQPKTGNGRLLKGAASLAQMEEFKSILENWRSIVDQKDLAALQKETALLITKFEDDQLDDSDLITEQKSIIGLCVLYTSMKWLATKLSNLRHISDRATEATGQDSGRPKHNRRWTIPAPAEPRSEDMPAYLPLNQETATRFDNVVQSYHGLASTALRTLHLEVRCHVLSYLNRSLRTPYQMEQLLNDPDPDVVALNADLVKIDELVTDQLLSESHSFVVNGLGLLIDQYLVTSAKGIKAMNEKGCCRMQLNILVLQQNLKNIEPTALLLRSTAFYDLFSAGPDAIITKAKEKGGTEPVFSYDELKVLIELCYSDALSSDQRDKAVQAKRSLDDHLLQLSEHLWQS